MFGLLSALRRRLYRIEETAVRAEQMQHDIKALSLDLTACMQLLQSLSETQQQQQHWQQQMIAQLAETQGIARGAQALAGDALASINDWRMRGHADLDALRQAQANFMQRLLAHDKDCDWIHNQYQVYSQFGEDGLIQLLLREIPISTQTFIEFGVEDYSEATTRFLLVNNRWKGLVLDGSSENMAALRSQPISQRYDLTACAAFITRENINGLLLEHGFSGPVGLLCIDIDGNDYWVWEAIDCVDPVIVIVEYNYRFGPDLSAVVPYTPDFVKNDAHPSAIYYGASLSALCGLAHRKGYALVGCSQGGVNAFFVRRDRLPATLPEKSAAEGYVVGTHAEMRNSEGQIERVEMSRQQELLLSLPLYYPDSPDKGRRDVTRSV